MIWVKGTTRKSARKARRALRQGMRAVVLPVALLDELKEKRRDLLAQLNTSAFTRVFQKLRLIDLDLNPVTSFNTILTRTRLHDSRLRVYATSSIDE